MKIKQLIWEEYNCGYVAISGEIKYNIIPTKDDYYLVGCKFSSLCSFDTLEEAKKVAQKDFENCIKAYYLEDS